MTHVKIVVLA